MEDKKCCLCLIIILIRWEYNKSMNNESNNCFFLFLHLKKVFTKLFNIMRLCVPASTNNHLNEKDLKFSRSIYLRILMAIIIKLWKIIIKSSQIFSYIISMFVKHNKDMNNKSSMERFDFVIRYLCSSNLFYNRSHFLHLLKINKRF